MEWLREQPERSVHAVVTDPPYGLVEYTRQGAGQTSERARAACGAFRRHSTAISAPPLPRFTTLDAQATGESDGRFLRRVGPGCCCRCWCRARMWWWHRIRCCRTAFLGRWSEAGLERRGEIIRLVMTMRGGDRPKNGPRGVPGGERHAAFHVGAVAGLPQADGRPGAGQPAAVEDRRLPAAVGRAALWGRDSSPTRHARRSGRWRRIRASSRRRSCGRWCGRCCRWARASCWIRLPAQDRRWRPPRPWAMPEHRRRTGCGVVAVAQKAIPRLAALRPRRRYTQPLEVSGRLTASSVAVRVPVHRALLRKSSMPTLRQIHLGESHWPALDGRLGPRSIS